MFNENVKDYPEFDQNFNGVLRTLHGELIQTKNATQ